MIVCLPTQALAFLAVFVYATHATHGTQAIAFDWKPGFSLIYRRLCIGLYDDNRIIDRQTTTATKATLYDLDMLLHCSVLRIRLSDYVSLLAVLTGRTAGKPRMACID